jgi:hypothetical protein
VAQARYRGKYIGQPGNNKSINSEVIDLRDSALYPFISQVERAAGFA